MPNLANKKYAYITRYRKAMEQLLDALHDLRELKLEHDALGYGTLLDSDFTGENDHMTSTWYTASVTIVDAMITVLTAGGNLNLTGLGRIRRN